MILVMDTKQEEMDGIGRFWTHRPLGEGEAHASSSLLRELKVTPNMGERYGVGEGGREGERERLLFYRIFFKRIVLSLSGLSLISSLFEDTDEVCIPFPLGHSLFPP